MLDINALATPAFTLVFGVDDGLLRFSGLNAVHTLLTGITEESVRGKSPFECFEPDVAQHVSAQYRLCAESGEPIEYEEELNFPRGSKWWRTTLTPMHDRSGEMTGIFGICVDITLRKHAEAELHAAVYADALTGVANRRRLEVDLGERVAAAAATGRPFSMIMADVDAFKAINDCHGHAVGDEVLRSVATQMRKALRDDEHVGRMGGDEFVALLSAAGHETLEAALDRVARRLGQPVRIGELRLTAGVSLGAVTWRAGMSAADMLEAADIAMYRQKRLRHCA